MLYEVKIFNGSGLLKETVTSDQLRERHWESESIREDRGVIKNLAAKNGSNKVKKAQYLCCKRCSKEFVKLAVNQQYCSTACQSAALLERKRKAKVKKKPIERECEEEGCKNVFIQRRKGHVRCGDLCRQRAVRRASKAEAERTRKILKIIKAAGEVNNDLRN